MTHGSLFSGIGGGDLAAEWMGWENIFHCEWNEFGQKVLKYYWPNAISYGNIKETNFTIHKGTIDVLSGGFPCQPYSVAGKRKGKEDERHLWPEMLRAIREIQPSWIVGENVRGLINWNGGMVFDEVQAEMETEGFEVLPFLLPACAVNAPHRRDRIWFIAYSDNNGAIRRTRKNEKSEQNERLQEWNKIQQPNIPNNIWQLPSNSNGQGLQGRLFRRFGGNGESDETFEGSEFARTYTETDWGEFPTQSPIYNGNDGIPTKLDGITISKWRTESIKAGGNAIVPQEIYQIFKAIEQYESIIQNL